MTRTAKAIFPESLVPLTQPDPPLSMVCCCLAEQMRRLMPSMTWLLESTSFSRGFLLRKMVGTGKQAETHLSKPLVKEPILSSPTISLSSVGRGSDLQKANPSSQVPRILGVPALSQRRPLPHPRPQHGHM